MTIDRLDFEFYFYLSFSSFFILGHRACVAGHPRLKIHSWCNVINSRLAIALTYVQCM